MVNTTIELELKSLDANDKEVSRTVQVMLQQVSPFKSMAVLTEHVLHDAKNKTSYDWAGIVQDMASNEVGVIVSPKNIIKQIEESTNAFEAIQTLGAEVSNFCQSPRIYVLKKQEQVQKESTESTGVLGEGVGEPNANGNEQPNA